MIVMAGLIGGALWGAIHAKRRGGNRMDMAQYAAVYGIIFGLLGLAATIAMERLL
ncbi:hypothetical protein [Alkalilacustris brevis]|uniref:hypothetical protein n=1 Tax=Alkalilacustris brevis TaxID=2026338 RepID=UPI00192E5272|nr:hypothetical protein [Alkalilacustris brevis]